MYIITGEFKVKNEFRHALITMSLELIPLSLREAGGLSYRFLENQAHPGHFLFFERWKKRADIAGHFEKSYFQDFAKRFPDMIDGKEKIEIYEISLTETV